MKKDNLQIVSPNRKNIMRGVAIGKSKTFGDIGRVSIYRFNSSHKRIVGQINPSGFVICADKDTMERLKLFRNYLHNILSEYYGITELSI